MTTKTSTGSPSRWILSPFWDGLLFIGAPVVCIVALLPLRSFLSSRELAVLLLTFFTFGHHLPGFIRAYGDRELFQRFRHRFLLAPPAIFLMVLWFDLRSLHGLLIFISAWDIWHVLMQHYGFMRIYDAKQGAVRQLTSRLDWGVSISWYLTLIAISPHYLHNLLSRAYLTGLPILPPGLLTTVRGAMVTFSILLTVVYIAHHLRLRRRGEPVSFRKLLLLGVFLAATYYLYVALTDFLVGFTVWSAFHCLQYYGIVWVFNRNRVDRGSPVRAFVRFLFRPQVGLALLYGGLILAYGGVNYIVGFTSNESIHRVLVALIATSNALHYYYDGFIWKVREPQTREYLNIASVGAESGPQPELGFRAAKVFRRIREARPGLLQASYLLVLLLSLVAFEAWRPQEAVRASRNLAAAAPGLGEAHLNLGYTLMLEDRLDDAIGEYGKATDLMPESPEAHYNLAGVLYRRGHLERAIAEYRTALDLQQQTEAQAPSNWSLLPAAFSPPSATADLIHGALGDALSRQGSLQEAVEHYRHAVGIDPADVDLRINLGATLVELRLYREGLEELEEAARLDPDSADAQINLGTVLAYLGRKEDALSHYELVREMGDNRQRQAAQAAIQALKAAAPGD